VAEEKSPEAAKQAVCASRRAACAVLERIGNQVP